MRLQDGLMLSLGLSGVLGLKTGPWLCTCVCVCVCRGRGSTYQGTESRAQETKAGDRGPAEWDTHSDSSSFQGGFASAGLSPGSLTESQPWGFGAKSQRQGAGEGAAGRHASPRLPS